MHCERSFSPHGEKDATYDQGRPEQSSEGELLRCEEVTEGKGHDWIHIGMASNFTGGHTAQQPDKGGETDERSCGDEINQRKNGFGRKRGKRAQFACNCGEN